VFGCCCVGAGTLLAFRRTRRGWSRP
jgi:hypothetical protein